MSGLPVIGEVWTDAPDVPHGTHAQVVAWLLAGPNPGRVARVTTMVGRGVRAGHVRYARALNARGVLGHEYEMEVETFVATFRRVPDEPPDPRDVPPERPS